MKNIKIYYFLWLKDLLSCVKQIASNVTSILALSIKVNLEEILLSTIAVDSICSFEKPLDSHCKAISTLKKTVTLEYLEI